MSDHTTYMPELGEAQYEAEQAMLAANAEDEAASADMSIPQLMESMNGCATEFFGTLAFTSRFMAEAGFMTGDEADVWKDEMKDRELELA